ncbi:MAG: hypothetical protein IT370_27925 [Deltaproteobacteria bacterium]|nr:hypothetical protein [Deltaproteobacteria bacterium]
MRSVVLALVLAAALPFAGGAAAGVVGARPARASHGDGQARISAAELEAAASPARRSEPRPARLTLERAPQHPAAPASAAMPVLVPPGDFILLVAAPHAPTHQRSHQSSRTPRGPPVSA